MKQGPILAVLVVAAYLGFEIFAVTKVAYRVEPVYIFERFVAMDRAMSRCGKPAPDVQSRFTRNRRSVRQRAELELGEENPEKTPQAIERMLAETVQSQEERVDALIDQLGCDDIEIFKLTRSYENRARLNIVAPVGASEG